MPRKREANKDRREKHYDYRGSMSWWCYCSLVVQFKEWFLNRRSGLERRLTGELRTDWVRCGPWASIYCPK